MADETINGRVFSTQPMSAKDAIALYLDIMRVLGTGVDQLPAVLLAVVAPDDNRNALADVAALKAVAVILRNTPTDAIMALVGRVLKEAQVVGPSGNSRPVTIDEFHGDLGSIVPVVKFIMGEQFRDFFTVSGGNGIISMIREALTRTK